MTARRTPADTAEHAARTAYGRLLALLSSRSRDIAAAEDALAAAFASALASWPASGVPDNPDAWLFTAARRNLGAARSRAATATASEALLLQLAEERAAADAPDFPDERLKLLFVCAHPGIAPAVQAPLMLQTVLGLDAARIAAAFMVTPSAMGQALVRAKSRIRQSGIAFTIPAPEQRAARLHAVRQAIYAAYGTGWDALTTDNAKLAALAPEASFLARLLLEQAPHEPESQGLLALILFCEARQPARRTADGNFVPLHKQDPKLWHGSKLAEAEALLSAAARAHRPGRFQLEAAIQSLHTQQRMTGQTLHGPLISLYDQLLAEAPSLGAAIARAAALTEAGAPAAALAALDALSVACVSHQPWWAARARALHASGQAEAARAAAERAAGLSHDPAVRRFLLSNNFFA
ncbi:MAG: RNA polymerase sigma factor [Polymorphobacter sp.]|uniref:RNA polymerase sigma factor n=1 Tax=Polymorphobacter sp. TaxID=1909290 RepID=UPI003A863C39